MGCCFSKEFNPNLVSEKTSLLQTSVTESCSDQDVQQYSSVTELAEEKRFEYGHMNKAVDFTSDVSSTDLSTSLGSVDKKSSTVQEGMVVWDKFKDDSHNKPLEDVSKDSGVQAQAGTAVLNSVKQRITQNAVKRANWFCEVDLSQHADSTCFKPQCENTAAAGTLVPNGHHIRATCMPDNGSSEVSITQNPDHGHADCSISQRSDVFFPTKYLHDDLLDSDEKRSDFLTSECSVKRRTQSFYSICSIDADDLRGEYEPVAMMQTAAFDQTDLLAETETKVFINTSLSNVALETLNGTKEKQEDGELVSEDLPTETLPLNTACMLPDIIGTFSDVGSDENAASCKWVSASPEDSVMEKSEKHGHKSNIAGLNKAVDETILGLLERNDQLGDTAVDHTDMDCLCPTHVNTDAELINVSILGVTETRCEIHCSETPEQEPKSVSPASSNLDYQENCLNSHVNWREPHTEVNLGVMRGTWHELVPCSGVKPHYDSVQNCLCSEISSVSPVIENEPSSFVTSSLEIEGDLKSRGFDTESSSQDTAVFSLNTQSSSSVKDSVSEQGKSICYAKKEDKATGPEPRSKFNSLQSLNSFTSDLVGGNGDALQSKTLQTGSDNYPEFDACPLLTHCDAEKREINLGVEDVTCHISSTELSDVVPESEVADETSENSVHINSNAGYSDPPEANQSLVKDFSENLRSLTWMEQEFSLLPDFSVHTNLLDDALQNHDDLKIGEKQMVPATTQQSFNLKEEDRCCLKENETLVKGECFNENALEGPNKISLSIGHVKTPEMELQNSELIDFDLTLGRNNDEQGIHLFLEGSSENAALSIHSSHQAKPPDTLESAILSKNGVQCKSTCVLSHTLLGKTDTQSSSDPCNQEPELVHEDVHTVSTAEQQVVIDYRVPLERTIRAIFEIGEQGHDGSDESMECFVTSRLQGYQLDGLHVSASSCAFGADGMCPISDFSADKAIPLPVEPDQVDLYASMPSYEIDFLGSNAVMVPVQTENPQSLTSTNESERDQGVLNMVSDLLGKSEVNEDGGFSHFLSLWVEEPKLESPWQCHLSEEELTGQDGQEEGKADSVLHPEHVQAFAAAYPYSLLVSDGACVWDWQNDCEQLVSLR